MKQFTPEQIDAYLQRVYERNVLEMKQAQSVLKDVAAQLEKNAR